MAHSLKWRLILWLSLSLGALSVFHAVLAYNNAKEAIYAAYDRSLSAAILAIAERTQAVDGETSVDIPYSAFEVFQNQRGERVYYAVLDENRKVLTGYSDLQAPALPVNDNVIVFSNANYKNTAIRIGSMRKTLFDPYASKSHRVNIIVAETTDARISLAKGLLRDSLALNLFLSVVGMLGILFAVRKSLQPLQRISSTIETRAADELGPISLSASPQEVQPLLTAINQHTGRLNKLLQARKRFFTDAAHQIRTPLAVIKAQSDFARKKFGSQDQDGVLAALAISVKHAERVAEQMLLLSRAESSAALREEYQTLEINGLIEAVALELSSLALTKNVALAYSGSDEPAFIHANHHMLGEALSNVIENAIVYSPTGTTVSINLNALGREIVISVADQGPGIPEDEREKVLLRFYRRLDTQHQGSGLGLSIVNEIMQNHRGQICFGDNPQGPGLVVLLHLPCSSKTPTAKL